MNDEPPALFDIAEKYSVGFMRIIIVFSLFGLLMTGRLPAQEEHPPLRVGMELSYPPFEMVCRDGKPCGISVEIAEELGKYLHRSVEIENIAFIGLIPSLNTGKIDLVISSLTKNAQREKVIDFSEPYLTTGLCLLVSIHSNLQNIEEANTSGRVIVVKSGTTGELYALKNLRNATIRVLDKESLCVLEVVQNKADAFIYDQFSVNAHWKKHPTTTRAVLTPFDTENWAIGIKKGDTKLLNQVNQFIRMYKAAGGVDKLKAKYEQQILERDENG